VKVAAVATKVTPEEMIRALGPAWTEDFGDPPKQVTIALILAHWALETGRGRSMMNYNVGNIKAPSTSTPHTYFQTWEVFPVATANKYVKASTATEPCKLIRVDASGKTARISFYPDHPVCRFRSYESLADGLREYLLKLRDRFKRAWPALLDGDPLRYVLALKAQGYMTADVSEYYRSVNSLFSEYFALIKAGDMPETIEQIQAALTQLGYNPGPIDGDLGPRTKSALMAFQTAHKLIADGVPGPKTKSVLQHDLFRLKITERSNIV
jgi:hypothetical protein